MSDTEFENMKKWKDETLRKQKKLGRLRQDESGHWYFIPEDKVKEFDSFNGNDRQFDELFGEYMLGGWLGRYLMSMEED